MEWEKTKIVGAAIIRWAFAFVGASLVKAGIIDVQTADAWLNEITATLLGLAVLAIPFVWKWFQANGTILFQKLAVQKDPPADTPKEIIAAVADVKAEVAADKTLTVAY